jgi:hypothetical protein
MPICTYQSFRENILEFDFAPLRRQYSFGIGHFAVGSISVLWPAFALSLAPLAPSPAFIQVLFGS